MKINTLNAFDRRQIAFWGTTYTFEPGLFDEVMFRRIGEAPLNANILVDASRIESLWSDWQSEPWRLGRINRDYLVRAVHLPAAAFHPKTYLLAGKNSATLLVGSGNLGINGMLEGNEVFSEFSSTTEEGASAIAAWREWMGNLVIQQNDDALTERWIRFITTSPWLPRNSMGSPFIHNLQRSMHDQLVEAVPRPVDELHVLAPFYDANCTALSQLVKDLSPADLHIYLPYGVSVDGTSLETVLAESGASIHLHGFSGREYVHAKLFGCITGNEAVLLSGSANCSRPALTTTADKGNVEAGVLTSATPEVVRGAFLPESWNLVPIEPDSLSSLTFRYQERVSRTWPMRLHAARLEKGRHVSVRYESAGSEIAHAVALDTMPFTLNVDRTVTAVDSDASPTFAWLVDAEGVQTSNAVPVDHTERLASWLLEHSQSNKRPSELYASDVDTEVGEMLAKLNREFIFDIDEVLDSAGRSGAGAEAEKESEDAASKFWDEFDPETLRFDPRSHRYSHLLGHEGLLDTGADDDLIALLESMTGRFLGEEWQVRGHSGPSSHQSHQVSVNPSMQRRVGNLLLRWSKSLNDQRFRWIDPAAPAVNYHLLLEALATSRAGKFVTPARASTITLALLQSFIGSEKRKGYILGLEEDERKDVLSRLSDNDAQTAAALVYAALSPASSWREVVFEWQPVIRSAIEAGLLAAGDRSRAALAAFSKADNAFWKHVSDDRIDDHLQELAVFINDTHWCKIQEEELGFEDIKIRMTQGERAERWPYTVTIAGVTSLRVDPRIVALINRTLSYTRMDGVILEVFQQRGTRQIPQRMSVSLDDEPSVYTTDQSVDFIFSGRLTKAHLREMEEMNQGFVEILVPEIR